MEDELIPLTKKEREFLVSLLMKVPVTVTLESLSKSKAIGELMALISKLKSDDGNATIVDREETRDADAGLPDSG